jgi:hypothetical protein
MPHLSLLRHWDCEGTVVVERVIARPERVTVALTRAGIVSRGSGRRFR